MKAGVIIGVYITVGILFAMYIVRKNIKDNHGEYDSGYADDDAMMTIAGSILAYRFANLCRRKIV